MNNQEKMIRWLLDTIDTEVAKPEGEADMALVDECTALLGELTGETNTIPERELKKRCRAITRGGKSGSRKKVRLIAAVAACLAVFVVMSGCGYLPSINVILSTLFASGVGEDVDVHEVTYTYMGEVVEYNDITQLISNEKLDIFLPDGLPDDIYITDILNDNESNKIIVMFNDSNISFHVFTNITVSELIPLHEYVEYKNVNKVIYYKELSDASFIAYTEVNNNVYYVQYTDLKFVKNILTNLR